MTSLALYGRRLVGLAVKIFSGCFALHKEVKSRLALLWAGKCLPVEALVVGRLYLVAKIVR